MLTQPKILVLDDTKIFGRVNTLEQHTQLQDDLNTLLQWSKDWQMLFNTDKCKVMHFGRNNLMMDYTLDNKSLNVVQEEKDLGIVISHDLKASAQCIQAYPGGHQPFDCFQVCQYHVEFIQVNCTSSS